MSLKTKILIEENSTNLFNTDLPYANVYFDKGQDAKLMPWLDVKDINVEVTLDESFDYSNPDALHLRVENIYVIFEEKQCLLFSADSLAAKRLQDSDLLHDIAERIAEYWYENIRSWRAEDQADQDDYYYEQAKDRRMEEALKEMEA